MFKTSSQYLRLTKPDQKIFKDFDEDKNREKLFKSLRESLKKQKNFACMHTRQSTYRGLLRKQFGFSNEDLKPIDFTDEQRQKYYELTQRGFDRQTEDVVTLDMIKRLVSVDDILYLMITSGRRISEILKNRVIFWKNGEVLIELNKKKKIQFHSIRILGSVEKWKEIYSRLDTTKNLSQLNTHINKMLKVVFPGNFYKRSSHICRAIYARYLYDFKTTNETLPQIIKKYLNHESAKDSVYYNHVLLAPDVPKNFPDLLLPKEEEKNQENLEDKVKSVFVDMGAYFSRLVSEGHTPQNM